MEDFPDYVWLPEVNRNIIENIVEYTTNHAILWWIWGFNIQWTRWTKISPCFPWSCCLFSTDFKPTPRFQVEKYGGYVPNYRARGEQHYRLPYKAVIGVPREDEKQEDCRQTHGHHVIYIYVYIIDVYIYIDIYDIYVYIYIHPWCIYI